MPVEIKSDATGEEVFMGTVSRISPTAVKNPDGTTQTNGSVEFETEVTLDDVDTGLRVGMNVRMTVVTAEKADAWAVPYEAVTSDATGAQVIYVARYDEAQQAPVAVAVPVVTGLETDFYIEITSDDLRDGDLILTEPAGVMPGMPVTLPAGMSLEPQAPDAADAATSAPAGSEPVQSEADASAAG